MNSASCPIDISLVIPAYNEAAYLPRLLDTVNAAREKYRRGPDKIEVIVADNCSTDETSRIAHDSGCRVERVSQRLIAAARNGGASVARGEIVAFADADFQIHPETFNYIHSVMNRPGLVGGGTGLVMERWSPGITATWYLLFPILWLLRFDGGVWFCRRADFLEVGGFDESRPMGEDIVFLDRLKRLGCRRRPKEKLATRFTARKIGLEAPLAINSSRKWDKHGEWHVIHDVLRMLLYFFFSQNKINKHISKYWYEDR